MQTLCVCQGINSVSESEGKLFCCQRGDNGGVPIGRYVCLSNDLRQPSSSFSSVTAISECSDIKLGGDLSAESKCFTGSFSFFVCTVVSGHNTDTRYISSLLRHYFIR